MSEENTNQPNEWQQREIGALWKKSNANQSFLTGNIDVSKIKDGFGLDDRVNVVLFKNNKKSKDNHPDYRLYLSREHAPQQEEEAEKETETEPVAAEEPLV